MLRNADVPSLRDVKLDVNPSRVVILHVVEVDAAELIEIQPARIAGPKQAAGTDTSHSGPAMACTPQTRFAESWPHPKRQVDPAIIDSGDRRRRLET